MSLQPGQDHEGAQGNAQRAFSMPSEPYSVCQSITIVTSGRNMALTQEEISAFKTIQQAWSLASFIWSLAQ